MISMIGDPEDFRAAAHALELVLEVLVQGWIPTGRAVDRHGAPCSPTDPQAAAWSVDGAFEAVAGVMTGELTRMGRDIAQTALVCAVGGLPHDQRPRILWPILAALRESAADLRTAAEVNALARTGQDYGGALDADLARAEPDRSGRILGGGGDGAVERLS